MHIEHLMMFLRTFTFILKCIVYIIHSFKFGTLRILLTDIFSTTFVSFKICNCYFMILSVIFELY